MNFYEFILYIYKREVKYLKNYKIIIIKIKIEITV